MAVAIARQREVPFHGWTVDRALQRTQHRVVDGLLFWLSLDTLEDGLRETFKKAERLEMLDR